MIIAGEPNPSPPIQHVEEQRSSYSSYVAAFHVRGLAERVGLRRSAAPSRLSIPLDVVGMAVGWAVLLVSTSVEVCVARERARGLETRRSRRQACRALYQQGAVVSALRARFLSLHFGCHAFFAICSA